MGPPGFVEIVSPAEDGFVPRPGPNRADNEFVVFGIITRLDERLWINIAVRRPVDRPDGKQPWFALDQSKLGSEDYLIGFETFENRNLSPFQKADFELSFVLIADPFALDLGADGNVALRLQIGCHDLA